MILRDKTAILKFLLIGGFFYIIPIHTSAQQSNNTPYLIVLGTVQDGGSPHLGCNKNCCEALTVFQKEARKVTSIAVIEPKNNFNILFEATPDIIPQWKMLPSAPKAIFLTHAHMGHYTGLLQLGREALGAKNIPVHVMPRMAGFLNDNGPWNQLISLGNIKLFPMVENQSIYFTNEIIITPLIVPHRDEFSETVGYRIQGPNKTVLFIPDIDKWSKWSENLKAILESVDYAFLDATFFDPEEINYRPLEEIPHPLVKETIAYLDSVSQELKNKVYFIHMNHTNPLLDPKSKATQWVLSQGFHVARKGQQFRL
ncbi:MBL fold metallo-hydrolase [Flavobacteriaceae bacterium]|nr:MBL fold metallo-hydrolase [Flavobacteriaceae bacterium]